MNDLTNHSNVGVRWQAEMEDHLATVRERLHVISRITGLGVIETREIVALHASVANAAATAALALAVANAGGDIELALSKLKDELAG